MIGIMCVHHNANQTLTARSNVGNSGADQWLYASRVRAPIANVFLLRSHQASVQAGEIPRRFFSSPLLASGHFAATLFHPIAGPATP